jgi:hypothetical protein
MEQLILLLLFGGIALIQWLVKKSAEARAQRKLEQQEQHGGPEVFRESREIEPPAQTEDPDASMRRLMEALGLPQEATPPPVPQRPVTPAPRPVTPPPLPQPPVLKVPERSAQRLPERTISKLPERLPSAAAAKRAAAVAKSQLGPIPEKPDGLSLRELLASHDSLKKAVILSEVLGAPKALKP